MICIEAIGRYWFLKRSKGANNLSFHIACRTATIKMKKTLKTVVKTCGVHAQVHVIMPT